MTTTKNPNRARFHAARMVGAFMLELISGVGGLLHLLLLMAIGWQGKSSQKSRSEVASCYDGCCGCAHQPYCPDCGKYPEP